MFNQLLRGALFAALAATPVYANFTFSGTTGGTAISGSASFSFSTPGEIVITLQNTSSQIVSKPEVLYGIEFSLNGSGYKLGAPTSITATTFGAGNSDNGYT